MPFKDRMRKALSRSSTTNRTNSSSSSLGTSNINTMSTVPTNNASLNLMPSRTTTSRLSKRLTWRGDKSPTTEKNPKKVEAWEDRWQIKPHKQKNHELLKGFEWKWRSSMDGRRSSIFDGVSPMASRVGSVDDGQAQRMGSVGKRHSAAGPPERSKSNGGAVDTVIEEETK